MEKAKNKFVVGITGASGIRLGIRLAGHLARFAKGAEIFVIFSAGAKMVAHYEDKIDDILGSAKMPSAVQILDDGDLDSPVSSGSFGVSATLIVPCSANSLAKIACGISDTLITRAALVALKERKPLVIAPREMPLNAIMLQNMLTLSNLGAFIAPPMLSYYANNGADGDDLRAVEDFLCGKWLDCIGVEHNLYNRWGENDEK